MDVHSLLQLPQATLLALDWWTNLSASSSLSRSKGLLLQSYCGQMLAKQVWGGARPVRFLGGRLVGSKPLRFHMSILELHAVLLSLQSSFVPVGFLVLVFSNYSATFQALLKQGWSRSLSVTSVVSSISYLCQEKELSISPHEYRGFSTSLQTPLCLRMFLPPESGRSVQQIDRLSMLSSLFGSGPDGYPLQLSAGSLHSPFIPPLHQNWMPGAWIEINVRGCTCFLLCLSDHSFPSPVFVQRQDGLVFKSSSSSFLSQGC